MRMKLLAAATALTIAVAAGQAEASVIIDITQVGGNVGSSGSGQIDLAGLNTL